MSELGIGLLIDKHHLDVIDGLAKVPVKFGAAAGPIPDVWFPPLFVESQGGTNSCGGHTEALACSHANFVRTNEVVRFSRRFAYLTAQSEGGFIGSDQGTSIHSLLAAATKYGCCREETFPFTERYSTNWTADAQREAFQHRHHGDTAFDLRDFDQAIEWLTDRRCILLGTLWTTSQDACSGIEDLRTVSGGSRRGYHARLASGYRKFNGELCPIIQNSHGSQWADKGRSVVTREAWNWWRRDPNFVALAFNEIQEIEPKRRSWMEFQWGDQE